MAAMSYLAWIFFVSRYFQKVFIQRQVVTNWVLNSNQQHTAIEVFSFSKHQHSECGKYTWKPVHKYWIQYLCTSYQGRRHHRNWGDHTPHLFQILVFLLYWPLIFQCIDPPPSNSCRRLSVQQIIIVCPWQRISWKYTQ